MGRKHTMDMEALYLRYKEAFDFIFQTAPTIGTTPANESEAPARVAAMVQDIHRLEAIGQALDPFNIFDATGIKGQEIRHSHLLYYMLSPQERHGLGMLPLRTFLIRAAEIAPPSIAHQLAIIRHDRARVERERFVSFGAERRVAPEQIDRRPDLVITFEEERFIVVVENKIRAGAGKNQLQDYAAWLRRDYPDWNHLMIFLTPAGITPEADGWVVMTYGHVVEMLDIVLDATRAPIDGGVKILLEHYRDYLMREVAADRHPCTEDAIRFYERHASAIDYLQRNVASSRSVQPQLVLQLRDRVQAMIDAEEGNLIGTGARQFLPAEWRNEENLVRFLTDVPIKIRIDVVTNAVRLVGDVLPGGGPNRQEVLSGLQGIFGGSGKARFLNLVLLDPRDFEPDRVDEAMAQLEERWREFVAGSLVTARAWVREQALGMRPEGNHRA